MDRQAHDYAAAMAFAQQQQQYGFHSQPQQFPQQVHGPPYLQHHPSLQQFPYHHHLPQQQLYPPHHHPLLHLQQQQQPPPAAFPPHLPPQIHSPSPFMHPFDSAPPPAAPPSDPELHKTIDKLVEYAVKNGPEFEAMIREKQQDNPAYGFLFGAEGHGYYRYKLWLTARASTPAFNPSFPSSVPMMPSHNSVLNASPPLAAPQLHQHSFAPSFDHHQQPLNSQPFLGQARSDYGSPNNYFKGLSGPLPSDVATELNAVLSNLNGTKESIKGAKMWFMQRSPFAPALAEALRDRIFALDDSERQLHIIFLANDILFDSLQRRVSPHELDNEALAFKPVMGQMLARVYNNPHNKDENQSRMEKILGFWASKEVYDRETISSLEKEMTDGLPLRSLMQKDAPGLTEPLSFTGLQMPSRWKLDPQIPLPGSLDHKETNRMQLPLVSQFGPSITQQFPPNHPITSQTSFPETQTASLPLLSHLLPPGVGPAITDQAPPPYPLFPPGLIPGMVRKMQIGSGVPYSPLSPLDIPTVIPPSSVSPSEILERVSKFFKEIGEVNPSEGPMDPNDGDVDGGDEREPPARKGGACIPPPRNLQVDPETGMYEDGSVDRKPGSSGRLGLGATADPNEASQYDDVYSSYRKQRSTNYHTSMSTRAAVK